MFNKKINYFSVFLLVLIICNFFHIFNYFTFPIKRFVFIPNLTVDMNIYFFLVPCIFLFLIHKKIIFKNDKVLFYFVCIFAYYLIKEYLYTGSFYFLNLTGPYSLMTINFINLIVGYYLIIWIFKNIDLKKISLSIKITFILFSILLIYYILVANLFVIQFNFQDSSWKLTDWFRGQSTFTSNSILYAYSFLFFITFEFSKYKKDKFIYFIVYCLIFYFYLDYNHSRSGLIIFILIFLYFFLNIIDDRTYRSVSLVLLIIIFIFSYNHLTKTISNQFNSIKISTDILNQTDNLDTYSFDEDEIKRNYPGLQSYGEIESNIIRIGTIYQISEKFLNDKKKIIFGMSAKEAFDSKILNYSNHSLLIYLISIFGLFIFIISIYFLIFLIGLKKFKKNQSFFLLTFLLILILMNDKVYSYYSIIIYLLLNKNINLTKLNEKN